MSCRALFKKSIATAAVSAARHLRHRRFTTEPPPPPPHNSVAAAGLFGLTLLSGGSLLFMDHSPPDPTGPSVELGRAPRPFLPKFLFSDATRRRAFFSYEKGIRFGNYPNQVFEYFASHRINGDILMTPADLMRAVVPVFSPSELKPARDLCHRGERSTELRSAHSDFFMLLDVNNDGLISCKEFIFFALILSIPESCFSVAFKMFDIDDDGEIDRDEFEKLMTLMCGYNAQSAFRRDWRLLGCTIEQSVEYGGLVEYFFGKDGKKRLKHENFIQFLRDLHEEMIRLEFSHYDYKCGGTISAKDFALSMVASGDISYLNRLFDRVEELDNEPRLNDIRITYEEFKNFAELRRRLQPYPLDLFSYGKVNGLLTRKDFQRAAFQVCGVSLSDNVVELVFHVFDGFLRASQNGARQIPLQEIVTLA